jgi:predicted Rossmann fold flavoprotein
MTADLIVVGGGAAGMFAAARAAERGVSTLLLERNETLGRKLRITGKGRCNLTNDCAARDALENVPTGARFLQSAFYAYPPSEVMAYFEGLGVPLKTERGRRVFPVSDDANDVADALLRAMSRAGVAVRQGRAERILTENGAVCGVETSGGTLTCRAVILATGGKSYPATGSTGDGYRMAAELGHTVTELRPSLVPLVSPDAFCAEMQGLSLKNVRLTVSDGSKKPIFEDFGELLFTHYGISGPLTLSASAHMRDFHAKTYTAVIDLKPALTREELDARLLRDFQSFANRDFSHALDKLLPRLMLPVVIRRAEIDPAKKTHSVTKAERARLLTLLKAFGVAISGPRPIEEAVITSGGVEPRELVPASMASKLVRGLYFAGEIIGADAYTGGYNLQIAWSTARAAAVASAAAVSDGAG